MVYKSDFSNTMLTQLSFKDNWISGGAEMVEILKWLGYISLNLKS